MLFQRLLIYFVLFVLITSIIFVFLAERNFKLPESLIFNNSKNNKNKDKLLISIIISLIITLIFIYNKENNIWKYNLKNMFEN